MLLPEALAAFDPALPLAVAFSGGADSTALLLACHAKWPGQVGAIHVHHGLQAAADGFERFCQDLCATRGIPFASRRVQARHTPGQSPEEAARSARYQALAEVVKDSGSPLRSSLRYRSVALAQHADDQIETLLLALSRGAGLPGLAAMPAQWSRDGVVYHRPLLEVPGAALRDWLQEQGVAAIEDPTNADEAYTRNRIRARVLPALQAAFPQFRATFARSARHAAQAQLLLDGVAADDLRSCLPAGDDGGHRLALQSLRALSPERQGNLLRYWLRSVFGVVPNTAQLHELQRQLATCTTRGHGIRIRVAQGWAVREGPCLAWYNAWLRPRQGA